MDRDRLEAFTDGVFAVLITILVLELKSPEGADWEALRPLGPLLLAFLLSFVYLGIYWSNHHHLMQLVDEVNGKVLWGNLHLLFWLSLIPFVTRWADEQHFAPIPTAAYGVVLLMAAVAWQILLKTLITLQGPEKSELAKAVGSDVKGKISAALYALAVPLAFARPWISVGIYWLVALIWLVPDPRVESRIRKKDLSEP
jgi:uncharacterized membrane protein